MIYFRNFLLEESWKTYKPSKNPKILLYDFYVLSYLSTLPLGPAQKGFSGSLIGRDPIEVKLDIEHAQSVLLPLLVKKLKNALFLGICAEIRHIFDKNGSEQFNELDSDLFKYYHRYFENLTSYKIPPKNKYDNDKRNLSIKSPRVTSRSNSYLISYKAVMMAIKKIGSSTTAFAQLAADLFTDKSIKWASGYGGKKWAEIAEGYLLLDRAHTNNQKQVAIDHAYDLQHNTGTALNKVTDFSIDGFDWIATALDHKRDAKNMYELLPHCSSDMKKLALEAFKIANVKKSNGITKFDIDLLNKLDTNTTDETEFNIGDIIVYKEPNFELYGTIVDKQKSLSEDVSNKYDYKILVTNIKGNAPDQYAVDQTMSVTADKVKNLKLVSKKTNIIPGKIYNVPDYGFFHLVDFVKPAEMPYKEISTGTVDFIYDLVKFNNIQSLLDKPVKKGSPITLHTDYLSNLNNIQLYDAKDSDGNLLNVGTIYKSLSMGVEGKLIKILPITEQNLGEVNKVKLEITKIIDIQVQQAYSPNTKVGDEIIIFNDLTQSDKTNIEPKVSTFNIGDTVSAENGAVTGVIISTDMAGDTPFYVIKITSIDPKANIESTIGGKISYYGKDLTLIKPVHVYSTITKKSLHILNSNGVPMVPERYYYSANGTLYKLVNLVKDTDLGIKIAKVESVKTNTLIIIPINDLFYDFSQNIAYDKYGNDISISKYYEYNYSIKYFGKIIVHPKTVYTQITSEKKFPKIICEVVQVFTSTPMHPVGKIIVLTPFSLIPISNETI